MISVQTRFVSAFGFVIALLAGCSGGGGSSPTVTYTGITTQAVISPANAETLATTALSGGSTSVLNTIPLGTDVVVQNSTKGITLPELASILNGMKDLTNNIGPSTALGATETLEGACGGSVTVSGDDTSSDPSYVNATGTMRFSNYCTPSSEGDVIVNGSISFSLIGTEADFTFTIASTYLTFSINGQSIAYSLDYTMYFTKPAMEAILTANYQAPDGKVYRVVDYKINISDIYADYPVYTVTISGTFYHPDHGYVTVSSPDPFTYNPICAPYPDSGELQLDGANGYIVLDATGDACNTYLLTWSVDGSGPVSEIRYW